MKPIRIEEQRAQWNYVAPGLLCRADRMMCLVYVYRIDGKEVKALAPNTRSAEEAILAAEEVNKEQEEMF